MAVEFGTPGSVQIERAGLEDAEAIYELLVVCGQAMAANGFANWDPPPTSVERLRTDVAQSILLIACGPAGDVVGTGLVSRAPGRPYDEDVRAGRVTWTAPPSAVAYHPNRLAVHPAWQGTGLGRALLRALEAHAREAGATVLRFDALASNGVLNAWYERLGCRRCGTRAHSGWTFTVFEKPL